MDENNMCKSEESKKEPQNDCCASSSSSSCCQPAKTKMIWKFFFIIVIAAALAIIAIKIFTNKTENFNQNNCPSVTSDTSHSVFLQKCCKQPSPCCKKVYSEKK